MCLFCDIPFDLGIPDRPENTVLYTGDNIYIKPALGPMGLKYYLINSIDHYDSFLDSNESTIGELRSIISSILKISNKIGIKNYTVFEHGSGSDTPCISGCIKHAHVHLILDSFGVHDDIFNISNRKIQSIPYSCLLDTSGKKYISIMENNCLGGVFEVGGLVPSQFTRRAIWHHMNKDGWGWNWKQDRGIKDVENNILFWNNYIYPELPLNC